MTIGRHSQSSRPNPSTLKWGLMSGVLGLALIAGSAIGVEPVSGGIGAGDGDAQNGEGGAIDAARVLLVPMGRGDIPLRVAQPNARVSAAEHANTGIRKTGAQDPDRGYKLKSSIVVRGGSTANTLEAVRKIETISGESFGATVQIENLAGFTGTTVLDVDTVANAVRLASLLRDQDGIEHVSIDMQRPRSSRGGGLSTDPLVPLQWHLYNPLDLTADHNVVPLYEDGLSGAGITVGVLDATENAFQRTHPELAPNVSNSLSMFEDPNAPFMNHGTSVTGLIGAKSNGQGVSGVAPNTRLLSLTNGTSVVETQAHQWKNFITHVKNHSWGPVWAQPFLEPDQMYMDPMLFPTFGVGAEWGANDLFPSSNTGLAIQAGADNGRGQKGVVVTWAAGNESSGLIPAQLGGGNQIGLPSLDYITGWGPFGPTIGNLGTEGLNFWPLLSYGARTEFDPYVSSIDTLAIAAVGEDNNIASYSTTGTAIFASAYSSGDTGRPITTISQITDFDMYDPNVAGMGFDTGFGGTSAAAPIAAGIFSLLLEARPDLTLRDIKHIIQRTALRLNYVPGAAYFPRAIPGTGGFWQDNGAFLVDGRDVVHSDQYGFGLINAHGAYEFAQTWTGLPPQEVLVRQRNEDNDDTLPRDIPDAEYVEVVPEVLHRAELVPPTDITFCVRYNYVVEEVEVILNMEGKGPGDIYIELISPHGTVSPLHMPRIDNRAGQIGGVQAAMIETSLLTYKHWGEFAGGEWTLRFQDFRPDEDLEVGEIDDDTMLPIDVFNLFPVIRNIPTLPGEDSNTEKSVLDYEVRIYGYNIGADNFSACENPQNSVCPHDIDADGIVTVLDLILFIELWEGLEPIGDWDQDGDWDFFDFLLYFQTWTPGYCTFNPDPDDGAAGGRPRPGEDGTGNERPI